MVWDAAVFVNADAGAGPVGSRCWCYTVTLRAEHAVWFRLWRHADHAVGFTLLLGDGRHCLPAEMALVATSWRCRAVLVAQCAVPARRSGHWSSTVQFCTLVNMFGTKWCNTSYKIYCCVWFWLNNTIPLGCYILATTTRPDFCKIPVYSECSRRLERIQKIAKIPEEERRLQKKKEDSGRYHTVPCHYPLIGLKLGRTMVRY